MRLTSPTNGCFRKWWVFPPNHPFVHRVFHDFHHFGGFPTMFGSTPKSLHMECFHWGWRLHWRHVGGSWMSSPSSVKATRGHTLRRPRFFLNLVADSNGCTQKVHEIPIFQIFFYFCFSKSPIFCLGASLCAKSMWPLQDTDEGRVVARWQNSQIFPEDNQLFWRWILLVFPWVVFRSHNWSSLLFLWGGMNEIWDMGSWLYKSSWQKLTVTWLYRDHWNPIPVSRAEILYIWCLTAERLVGTKRILCRLPCCALEIYACWI